MQAIRSATVIGSGVMGAQIAAQLANCGIPVLLLDLPSDKGNRNSISEAGKAGLKKIKPSPLYTAETMNLISCGNLEDDLGRAGKTDWIIEAIVEMLEPKLSLFEKLAKVASPSTIISTNTSGIPLSQLSKPFGGDLKKRFLATHFFNPPRYLRLVEIIESPDTSDETLERINHVLKEVINKVPVNAKDVPCFIANRIGVHAMVNTLKITREFDLSVEEIDKLTGSLIGRPKTGTYRLADLVGLDTLCHIIDNLNETLPSPANELFVKDEILVKLIENKALGKKVGCGFYKKEGRNITVLDMKSGEYQESSKVKFDELKDVFKEEELEKKLQKLFATTGKGADAAKAIVAETLAYAAEVAPEVSDNILDVDQAMELGFAWDIGPFKTIDAIGVDKVVEVLDSRGVPVPEWMKAAADGNTSMYAYENGTDTYKEYSGSSRKEYTSPGFNLAMHKRGLTPVMTNSAASLWEIGDDVLLLEFHTKMNAQDLESLKSIYTAVEKAEAGYRGLVIANQATHFCAGANIGMVLMDAINGEYENIRFAAQEFQKASMAIKYASVPVVVSPHSLALGGGCEFVMHSRRAVLSPETYIGLVEVGVGLLPAGGGTKELTVRNMDPAKPGIALNNLAKAFESIAMGKVATSAKEAYDLGILEPSTAIIASNDTTRIDQAKAEVLAMSDAGYRPPAPALHIEVLGKEALAAFETAIFMIKEAGYGSEHDGIIAGHIAKIMAGGNVTPGTVVDEQYLLDLEVEGFMTLIGTKKTQERIEHMLKKGKPLRN